MKTIVSKTKLITTNLQAVFIFLLIAINRCLLISLLLLFASCYGNQEAYESNNYHSQTNFDSVLSEIYTSPKFEKLFELGLYNLAFEAIHNHSSTDQEKIYFANKFIDNGEFDKGLYIASTINRVNYHPEVIFIQLRSALSKQDNNLSQLLLDSIIKLGYDTNLPEKKLQVLLHEAYLKHNQKLYEKSIYLNLKAIQLINKYKLSYNYLATAYRRLGNDYNDIIRNKVPFHENRHRCFKKATSYYNKELDIITRNQQLDKARLALNYITTAMLERSYSLEDNQLIYYEQALNNLIVYVDTNFIVTRNPVYTSIALTQLAEFYHKIGKEMQMDSIIELNKKILTVRSFYKINDKQSIDLWEYFPQRSHELKILRALKKENFIPNNFMLLQLSNSGKYANQYLKTYLDEAFGINHNNIVKSWILLNELMIYTKLEQPRLYLNQDKFDRLKFYNTKINDIINKNKCKITIQDIYKIKEYCKKEDAIFIDYNILHWGSILITKITKDEITTEIVSGDEVVKKDMIDSLLDACKRDDKETYRYLSVKISNNLRLKKLRAKKIIICSDEYLEKLPFDALITESYGWKTWSDFNYLGKQHVIQIIPNIFSLINVSSSFQSLKIDIWTSELDNSTLPYNHQLIDELNENYDVQINLRNPKYILHVLSHTYRTGNGIEFRLNNDTLKLLHNKLSKPSLAILQSCSSGDGKFIKMEGSLSHIRDFLYSGTNTVIYSIWDADNYSSMMLFKKYYEYLSRDNKTDKSLYLAKLSMINDMMHPEWANPYYWANFQQTGSNLSFSR